LQLLAIPAFSVFMTPGQTGGLGGSEIGSFKGSSYRRGDGLTAETALVIKVTGDWQPSQWFEVYRGAVYLHIDALNTNVDLSGLGVFGLALTSLQVTSSQVRGLAGLGGLPNLQRLDFHRVQQWPADEQVPELRRLEELICDGWPEIDLFQPAAINLKKLDLNYYTRHTVAMIAESFPLLEELRLDQVTFDTPEIDNSVPTTPCLFKVKIISGQAESLEALLGKADVEDLELSGIEFAGDTSLSPLRAMEQLTSLTID
jgi:hypothetical protein